LHLASNTHLEPKVENFLRHEEELLENPYFANFSFSFRFHAQNNWPYFWKFPISHSYKRSEAWSKSWLETEILLLGCLISKSTLSDQLSAKQLVFIHLLASWTNLAHSGIIVSQLWAKSAPTYLTVRKLCPGSALAKHVFSGDEPYHEILSEWGAVNLTR
jgi:hypothetical protein